jgi:hypothetical protein
VYSVLLSGRYWCARLVAAGARVGVGWLGMHSKGQNACSGDLTRTDAQHASAYSSSNRNRRRVYVIKSHTNWTSSLSREGPSLTVATDSDFFDCPSLIHLI